MLLLRRSPPLSTPRVASVSLSAATSRWLTPRFASRAASTGGKRRRKPGSSSRIKQPSAPAKAAAAAEAAAVASVREHGAAKAALGAIADAEASLSPRDHLIRFGLWTLVSLNVGFYFSSGDEGAQLLENAAEFTSTVLSPRTSRDALESALERMARGLALNDSLKLVFLRTPGLVERLLELVDAPSCPLTSRNHAVKTIEAMSGSPEAQREMARRGDHVRLIELMGRDTTSLFARKAIAHTLANLCLLPENAAELARAGTVGALIAEQASDPRLVRQRVALAAARLAHVAHALGAEVTNVLPEPERALIARLAAEEEAAAAEGGAWHGVKASLIESGVLLYLHTACGGAAWGLFESLRGGQSRSQLVQNVVRTGVVTCFVPILFVGGVVTGYMRLNRTTDSIREKFFLYFGLCVALYPAGRLLSIVERFAPLWLGGHIVGFSSFFVWTLYTESDLLKSDAMLDGPPTNKTRTVVVWEAQPPGGVGPQLPPPARPNEAR